MDDKKTAYETVTDAISGLVQRGYTHDLETEAGKDCLYCRNADIQLSPADFEIDEIHRFEGDSDPGDEMIVYAISSPTYKIKGYLVNAFGPYADSVSANLLEKLSVPKKEKLRPIKRHAALIQFSREHHFGLLLVWKIRQGLKLQIESRRIADYVLHYFTVDLQKHFTAEEIQLFPLLPEDDPLRKRAELEHRNIYRLIELLRNAEADASLLKEFADALHDHIRFEERTLYNHVQELKNETELMDIFPAEKTTTSDPDDAWEDHFWVVSL